MYAIYSIFLVLLKDREKFLVGEVCGRGKTMCQNFLLGGGEELIEGRNLQGTPPLYETLEDSHW